MEFLHHTLPVQFAGNAVLLDAVHDDDPTTRGFRAFFKKNTPVDEIDHGPRVAAERLFTIGDAAIFHGRVHGTPDSVEVLISGTPQALRLSAPQTDLFAGLNSALTIRNGESAQITAEWLEWHVSECGLQAALILDRAEPGSDPRYVKDLAKLAADIPGLERVLVVDCPVSLGAAHLPSEAHPFNTPGAPGKDRMEVPDPSPWDAPFDNHNLFELLRHKYLDRAAAVLHVELHDLVRADQISPFKRAESEGCVIMGGRQVYPWRPRGDEAHFADHICVQFDATKLRRLWCVNPTLAGPGSVWRPNRVVGPKPDEANPALFDRHMAIRHAGETVSKIVPKSSLIEDADLLERSESHWSHKPIRMPEVGLAKLPDGPTRVVVVTCMKNEGPFILEWLAYHRAIGVTDVLVYTNDCDDGTDTFLDLLQEKGYVQHRDNPFRETGQKPQHAALGASDDEDVVKNAHWAISMDVDEFINVKVGDGTLQALFDAAPDANLIACTWRLFGNSDIHEYDHDELLTRDYTLCANEYANKPHQAWGFKTLFKKLGIFKKMGVHRPKGLNPQLWHHINWINGSGQPLPQDMFRNAWRSTSSTYGYDMVQLNHYAVRSAESFLVKRDRGRVNHVDRDQGLAYWFRMNNNGTTDTSIQNKIPMMMAERDRILADPEIRAQHESCIAAHRAKIDSLRERDDQKEFYATLTGERMERLSKMHQHFGSNIFLGGPQTVPDEVVFADHPDDYFFTVESIDETQH